MSITAQDAIRIVDEFFSAKQSRYGKTFVTQPIDRVVVDETAQVATVPVAWFGDRYDDGSWQEWDHWTVVDMVTGELSLHDRDSDHPGTMHYMDRWQALRAGARKWGRQLSDDNNDIPSDDFTEGFRGISEIYGGDQVN